MAPIMETVLSAVHFFGSSSNLVEIQPAAAGRHILAMGEAHR